MTTHYSLNQLGWSTFFQQQLTLEEWDQYQIARVSAQHRSQLELFTEQGTKKLALTPAIPALTVGDWLLIDHNNHFYRSLDRLSLFSRKAAGSRVAEQMIAANLDTVFIVCALNNNFNLNRIERYQAMVRDAGAEAVIVLTRADCCDDPQSFVRQVQDLDPLLMVEAVNGLDASSTEVLKPWCRNGQTVALLGSSGVGKSTLINTLLGQNINDTGSIREADSKGRHTTTGRSLHMMPSGGILMDTPGMRELQLADCEQGIEETFSDISALAEHCRYSDCQHQSEPGCAVTEAIERGELEQRRLNNYHKLMREQAINGATIAEQRAKDRAFGRMVRSVMADKKRQNGKW